MTRTLLALFCAVVVVACDGEGECDQLVEDAKEAALIDAPGCDFLVSIDEELCDLDGSQSAAPRDAYLDIFCRDASASCILNDEEIIEACE